MLYTKALGGLGQVLVLPGPQDEMSKHGHPARSVTRWVFDLSIGSLIANYSVCWRSKGR